MILQLDYEVSKIGVTSIEILVEGKNFLTGESHLTGRAVFVTVDENGKKLSTWAVIRNEGNG